MINPVLIRTFQTHIKSQISHPYLIYQGDLQKLNCTYFLLSLFIPTLDIQAKLPSFFFLKFKLSRGEIHQKMHCFSKFIFSKFNSICLLPPSCPPWSSYFVFSLRNASVSILVKLIKRWQEFKLTAGVITSVSDVFWRKPKRDKEESCELDGISCAFHKRKGLLVLSHKKKENEVNGICEDLISKP